MRLLPGRFLLIVLVLDAGPLLPASPSNPKYSGNQLTPTPTWVTYTMGGQGCVRLGTADGPAVPGVTLKLTVGSIYYPPRDTAITDESGCASLQTTWSMPPGHREVVGIRPESDLYTFVPPDYQDTCPMSCDIRGTFIAQPVATFIYKVYLPLAIGWPCSRGNWGMWVCAPFTTKIPPGRSITIGPDPTPGPIGTATSTATLVPTVSPPATDTPAPTGTATPGITPLPSETPATADTLSGGL